MIFQNTTYLLGDKTVNKSSNVESFRVVYGNESVLNVFYSGGFTETMDNLICGDNLQEIKSNLPKVINIDKIIEFENQE